MKKTFFRQFAASMPLFFGLLWMRSGMAYDLPGINLGLTSYLDGVLPAGPGLYYQNYLEYYTAARFNDAQGTRLRLPDEDLTLWADTNQFTYYFKNSVGPGRIAIDLVIPAVVSAHTSDGVGGSVLQSHDGIGDIFFAPIYQFNPIALGDYQSLHQSFEFDVLAPTGSYDRRLAINPGNNFWALNPFYSVTLFASQKLSFSGRFHYLYNFTNTEPNVSLGNGARTSQAGQALHFNFDIAYNLTKRLGLGLNAYYLKQFTNTRINDRDVAGRNERVLGVGPGAVYMINQDTYLFFNAYAETLAQNRAEGERVLLRVVHHF